MIESIAQECIENTQKEWGDEIELRLQAEATADRRLGLLRRAHIALKAHNPWSDLVHELAEEIGE